MSGDMEPHSAPETASDESEKQEALVAAFTAGSVVGAPRPITRVDTHLSHIFMTGDLAFKLKRAVRLPFADFESCEARRAACEAELAVNAPLAGPLYLDVRPVTRATDGGFCIGGGGKVIDWVVAMRRFDQSDQFDQLARAGKLTRALLEGAVDVVARAHAATPANLLVGHTADYRHVIQGLRETEEHGAARLGLHAASPLLFERLDFELTHVSELIEQRRRQGKVRRGHGDLHLRNLCVFQGVPTPFDALEFDARLATTDVIYDVAFLLMDLRRIGLAAHANAAMNRYWDVANEDESALALLPFFMALRAAVRMAVAVETGDLTEAKTYRALSLDLLERRRPVVLAIGGLSGVGKSAVAEAVAPRLPGPAGARLLRTDVLRKRMANLRLDEKAEEKIYAPERRAEVYREMGTRAAATLHAGESVVADATFQSGSSRDLIADAARGALFHAYWLEAPLSVRAARVSSRVGNASDANVAIAAAQEEPRDLPGLWRRVDADRPVDAVVAEILRELSSGGGDL
jgi:uncharacterized protein